MSQTAITILTAAGILLAWAALLVAAVLAFTGANVGDWVGFLIFAIIDAYLFSSVLKKAVDSDQSS